MGGIVTAEGLRSQCERTTLSARFGVKSGPTIRPKYEQAGDVNRSVIYFPAVSD
jgi:hypothetical protein